MAAHTTTVRAVAEAVVDLDAIAHNTALLSGCAAPAATMAVVKADAFGHGLAPVARAALAHGATWLGVTSVTEALQVRAAGLTAPLLAWLYAGDEDFAPAIEVGVELTVSSTDQLAGIADGARRAGEPARIHLKVDTGLTRNGMAMRDWPELVRAARERELDGSVVVRGVWSHLASADDPGNASVPRQVGQFVDAIEIAHAAGLRPRVRHLANSAAIVSLPETHFDLVRAGLALYGIEPIDGFVSRAPGGTAGGLRPAMTLRARAINVKRVPAGTGVSYLHEHVTERPSTMVLVPLGYADGIPRLASNRGEVLIAGTRCRIAGRVAMDQFVVDAGDLDVRIGDEVVVFGPGDDGEPTAQQWAGWAQTNPHEILTGIGARVPRRYLPVRGERADD